MSRTMGTGSFPGVKSGRGVTLTPHPLLVPWSRNGRAIPLLPLWAVSPGQSLSACTRVIFILYSQLCLENSNDLGLLVHLVMYFQFHSSRNNSFSVEIMPEFGQTRDRFDCRGVLLPSCTRSDGPWSHRPSV